LDAVAPWCPDPLFIGMVMGIMVAPAGIADAVAGDTAVASSRMISAHAPGRIIILDIFTIVIT
jgi:hypothetical protein